MGSHLRLRSCFISGLDLTPNRPTFVQARDALVSSVTKLDPSDLRRVWAGFAKQGMGAGAVAPGASSTDLTGITGSFTVPTGLPQRTPPARETPASVLVSELELSG